MTTSERLRTYAATLWFFPGIASGLMRAAVEVDHNFRSLDEIVENAMEQCEIDASVQEAIEEGVAAGSVIRFPERGRIAMRKVV